MIFKDAVQTVEQGELPPDLKCGVFYQDAPYDLPEGIR